MSLKLHSIKPKKSWNKFHESNNLPFPFISLYWKISEINIRLRLGALMATSAITKSLHMLL